MHGRTASDDIYFGIQILHGRRQRTCSTRNEQTCSRNVSTTSVDLVCEQHDYPHFAFQVGPEERATSSRLPLASL